MGAQQLEVDDDEEEAPLAQDPAYFERMERRMARNER
jgi:hypothetical protein